ncbi:MAG: hypothetical protein WBA91_02455 [Paracoccaceae bacterium]
MTNRIALVLAALVVAAGLLDAVATGGVNILFLARKIADLADWLAFWR